MDLLHSFEMLVSLYRVTDDWPGIYDLLVSRKQRNVLAHRRGQNARVRVGKLSWRRLRSNRCLQRLGLGRVARRNYTPPPAR